MYFPLAPQITKFPSDMSAIEGMAVYLIIKTDLDQELQPRVNWYHNGEPIEEDYAHEIEANGSLILPSVERCHSGIYKVMVSNVHGSVWRDMKLVVREEVEKTVPGMAVSEIVYTRPIPVSHFVKYVAELHVNVNQPFKDLFQVSVYILFQNESNDNSRPLSGKCRSVWLEKQYGRTPFHLSEG